MQKGRNANGSGAMDDLKNRASIAAAPATLLLALAVAGGACACPGWRREHDRPGADLHVTGIAQAVERDGPGGERSAFCRDFSLTAEQIGAFLANAREVDAIQFHDEMWLPCLVVADVRQGGLAFKVTISASFVAWLSYPDDRQRWLVCDKACQAALKYDWSK
jgi:hypothetical protein